MGDRLRLVLHRLRLGRTYRGVGVSEFMPTDPEIVVKVLAVRAEAREALSLHPTYRYGQAIFNAVYNQQPILAVNYIGTSVDPFDVDSRVEAFLKAVYTDHRIV